MKDIQSSADFRRIDIRKVGVKTLTYPIMVLDKANRTQSTVARINMFVNLPHQFKGTHMSRFVEILNQFHGALNLKTFRLMLEAMKERLDAEAAHLQMDFPYFVSTSEDEAPLRLQRYDCRLHGSLAEHMALLVEVDVPVALGTQQPQHTGMLAGHWGIATVAVRMTAFLWIEDLIALVQQGMRQGQSPVLSVEHLCLRIGEALESCQAVQWYKVVVKNSASGYSAFAVSQGPHQQTHQSFPQVPVIQGAAGTAFTLNTSTPTDCDE